MVLVVLVVLVVLAVLVALAARGVIDLRFLVIKLWVARMLYMLLVAMAVVMEEILAVLVVTAVLEPQQL